MLPRVLTLLSIMVAVFAVHEDADNHSGDKTFNDGSGPEPEPEAEEEEVASGNDTAASNKTTKEDILPPIPQITFGWREAGIYSLGLLVGLSTTQAENVKNDCLSDVAGMIDAGYNVYFYMDRYLDNGKDINMAWAITYMIKLFERGAGIDCSTLEEDIGEFASDLITPSEWINLLNPFYVAEATYGGDSLGIRPEIIEALKNSIVMPKTKYLAPLYYVAPLVKQDDELTDEELAAFNQTQQIFDTVFEVLLDVEIIIAAAEIYIGGSTAFTLFLDEQFFQSGFYTGSSSFGFWYVTRDIWVKYVTLYRANYGAYF